MRHAFQAGLLGLLMVSIALAGCNGGNGNGGDGSGGSGTGGVLSPTVTVNPPSAGKGIMIGVVVDDAIRPIQGAAITVSGGETVVKTTTDANGGFGFSELNPGSYSVKAEKLGYFSATQLTEVNEGETNPKAVQLILALDEATRPFTSTFIFKGFLECGAGSPGGSVNPCFASESSQNVFTQELAPGRTPDFIQSEMTWAPTTPSQGLWMSMFDDTKVCNVEACDYVARSGPSPLILSANMTLLENWGVGDTTGINHRVFPGSDEGEPVTVTAQQEFDIVTVVFYGYVPPEGWTFGSTGDVPPAPQ